ncbi:phospholipase A1-IIdelta [Diospyros lotus]|uniref:phospholipase A1-IIdelta n=1 Tax=Diospyros lotus TaxID=55363 RepID=UPI00225239E4|nr:phospholipase A1-IIdelta [Diospyros lotus]
MDLTQDQPEPPTWAELLGSGDWEGLLDPLNLVLRRLILRCGDFCQATYDAFNNDQNSRFCGTSRYGKSSFFHKVMLPAATAHYDVAAFLYGTARVGVPEAFLLRSLSRDSWDRETNWIGYVAVSSDAATRALGRREIYVVWRGTTRNYEWVDVLQAKLGSAEPLLRSKPLKMYQQEGHDDTTSSSSNSDGDDDLVPKIMNGWLTIYTSSNPESSFTKESARTQLQNKIRKLIEKYRDENPSIILTGHSLGASLSIVAGFDLAENGVSDIPITAFVFGCPQVGNKAFDDRLRQHRNLKILHVKNTIDMIPLYPSKLMGYVNSGVDLVIDTRKSPSLMDSKNPSDWHNLQAMLHIVAGWNGEGGEFEMKVKRSLALVNKSCEFLKDECLIPGSWWVEKNKGLVLDEDGEWVYAEPEDEDRPVPEYM